MYYAELRVSPFNGNSNYSNFANDVRDAQYRSGTFGFTTILHELGHNLGLKHTDDGTLFPGVASGNSSSAYGTFGLNNILATVMSYNGLNVANERTGQGNPRLTPSSYSVTLAGGAAANGALGFSKTPMALDVALLQTLYGKNNSYNLGNNVYVLPRSSDANFGWSCIWDAGGTDSIVAPNTTTGAIIDLRNANLLNNSTAAAGFYSYLPGQPNGGYTIAHDWNGVSFGSDSEGINYYQCVVENARGAKGSDKIYGNKVANVILGYDLHDEIYGLGGNDTLNGDAGNDRLEGGDGNDALYGGSGNDTLYGGNGNDLINGTGRNYQFGNGISGSIDYIGADGNADIDILWGNGGNDIFELIGNGRCAYNDRNSATSGRSNYAYINDFNNGDMIRLLGNSSQYQLSRIDPGSNVYELFLGAPGAGQRNELVALITNDGSALNLNNSHQFQFLVGNPAF